MTKLAPIEELALATGLILKTTNLELCPSYLNKLEQLRQAAIRDFVNGLVPVGYLCQKQQIDGWATIYQFEQEEISVNPNGHFNIQLFDLSEWMEK